MEKYLPMGAVVLLKGGNKRVMIYGRRQIQANTDIEWDYLGCFYPEGYLTPEYTFLFNHEQIEKVYHFGYQDDEEFKFVSEVLKSS